MNSSLPSLSQTSSTEILQRRARELAREEFDGDAPRASGAHLEIIEFVLGEEKYAIETRHVREAYPLKELAPLPGTPAFLPGIVNVRGQILAVLDLKAFFDLPRQAPTSQSTLVIVSDERNGVQIGILADEICGVRALEDASLQSELPHLSGARAEYLRGVASEANGPLIVLDVEAILNDEKILIQ